MSAKGKIAKQESGRKAIEILAWIIEQANSGKIVLLSEDWGGNSLTVGIGVFNENGDTYMETHTHVGGRPDNGMDQFIDNFHSTVSGEGGLSWA